MQDAQPDNSKAQIPQIYASLGNGANLSAPQRASQPNYIRGTELFPSRNRSHPVVHRHTEQPIAGEDAQPMANGESVSGLENRMRQMILHNQRAVEDPPGLRIAGPASMPQQSKPTYNRSSRRANQAERRQGNAEAQKLMLNIGQSRLPTIADPRRSDPQSQQNSKGHYPDKKQYSNFPPPAHYTPPHSRGQPWFGRANTEQWPYARPPPQHNQLFNPIQDRYQDGLRLDNSSRGGLQSRGYIANIRDQINYIDFCARDNVSRVEISIQEYNARHSLNATLEKICRMTVTEYERQRNPSFAAESVQLKCFGSLSTNFATTNSDMDLVLLSPCSIPDASSSDSGLPRLIEKTLLDQGFGARLLSRTRVPIIKFCQKPTVELLQRLRDARSRWEEERNVPVPTAKKPAKKKKIKTSTGGQDKPDPTLPQNRPHTADECMSPASESMEVRASTPVLASKPDRLLSSLPVSEVRSAEHAAAAPGFASGKDLEGDDPSLDTKTDEERARLYKLAIREEWYEAGERSIIFDFIRALETSTNDDALKKARARLKTLPNVLKKYRPPPEKHLDFAKDGLGIQCDINFSNRLGLHNSALLRCYSLCDSRVRPMVLFIKAWAKKRKINSAYESTLSSYGYVLMVLHYLANIASPPVVPNLQHYPGIRQDELSSQTVELDGYDVQFFRNENVLRKLAAAGQLTSNQEPLAFLIRGFFRYFGGGGPSNFHWMGDVLSLRTLGGILTKQSKGWIAAKTETMDAEPGSNVTKDIRQRYLIAIEDPFETHHNVGRTVSHDGIVAIRDEFRRAHRLIQSAGIASKNQEHLLEEAESRGNLQYRFFGPRPRRNSVKAKGEMIKPSGSPPEDGTMCSAASQRSVSAQDARGQQPARCGS
ncbi:MAG: hypothetical protein Q9163_005491 [Psora crenata]